MFFSILVPRLIIAQYAAKMALLWVLIQNKDDKKT